MPPLLNFGSFALLTARALWGWFSRLSRGAVRGLVLWCSLVPCVGCATAVPLLPGSTTTPEGRAEVAVGGAARIPHGELRDLEELEPSGPEDPQGAQASGVSPVVQGRYGLSEDVSLGLTVTGPQLAADVGIEVWVDDESSYRPALRLVPAAYAGILEDGYRIGGDVPLLLTFDVSSVVGLWFGPRVGAESAFGDIDGQKFDLLGLRAGAVAGVSVGFRHVHALIELTAAYEHWSGELDAAGLSLTPAFVFRLRI